ncbi:MAG: hypothetical protein K8H88_02000 [Sandaracinaceae bacterium]|nr:hypothetical protein [Sandaracinaceae bacterium]
MLGGLSLFINLAKLKAAFVDDLGTAAGIVAVRLSASRTVWALVVEGPVCTVPTACWGQEVLVALDGTVKLRTSPDPAGRFVGGCTVAPEGPGVAVHPLTWRSYEVPADGRMLLVVDDLHVTAEDEVLVSAVRAGHHLAGDASRASLGEALLRSIERGECCEDASDEPPDRGLRVPARPGGLGGPRDYELYAARVTGPLVDLSVKTGPTSSGEVLTPERTADLPRLTRTQSSVPPAPRA